MLDDTPFSVTAYLGAIATDGTEIPVWVAPCKCVVKAVYMIERSTVSANATNYATYTLYNRGTANAGTTVVAQRATDTPTTDDITAYVPWQMTNSTTAASLEVASGEVLSLKEADTNSGVNTTETQLILHYVPGTGAGQ